MENHESPAAENVNADQNSVGAIVDRLQANGLLDSGQPQPESSAEVDRMLADRERKETERHAEMGRVLGLVGPSPVGIQVKFLKGLAANPEEARKFADDPSGYSKAHGVLLDPKVVRGISDSVLYGQHLSRDILDKAGTAGVRDILDLQRGPGGVAAWPAAVAAVAAVVSAAAAVVTAVTAVTSDHARDILALKGLGPNGVRMPGVNAGLPLPVPGPNPSPIGPPAPQPGPGPMPGPDGPIGNSGAFVGGFMGRR